MHAMAGSATVLSKEELPNGRTIEQLEDQGGQLYYRACTPDGQCRYCEDLWLAHVYAGQLED